MSSSDEPFPEFPTATPRRSPEIAASNPSVSVSASAPATESASTPNPEPGAVPATTPEDTTTTTDGSSSDQTSTVPVQSSPAVHASEEAMSNVVPTRSIEKDIEHAIEENKTRPYSASSHADVNFDDDSDDATHERNDDSIRKNDSMLIKISSTLEIRTAALRARLEKRETKLKRVMESARNRGSITNDGIEKLLHVSDATATRYAKLLVQRGDLTQHGKGPLVRYSPNA